MDNLIIEETKQSLGISLDAEKGIFSLKGNSYPENTFELYQPMMDWIPEYFNGEAQNKTIVNMEIIYYNSSTSRLLFEFFDLLDEAKEEHDIEVNWIYEAENDSSEEAGEDFIEEFPDLNIQLVEKTD